MKRTFYVMFAACCLAGTLAAAQSSLGDYARTVRKDKEQKPAAAKKYDNDNLPRQDKLSVVGNAPDTTAAAPAGDQANAAPTNADSTAKEPEVKSGQSAEDRQKAYADWQTKITEQQGQVDLLSRELDVQQREYRLRAAAFYADAGARLRDAAIWDKQDAQYKQQIAQKQKALDAAKQHLQDLQEQARKSGVPASMRK